MLLVNVAALLLLCVVYLSAAPPISDETKIEIFEMETKSPNMTPIVIAAIKDYQRTNQSNGTGNKIGNQVAPNTSTFAIFPYVITGGKEKLNIEQSNKIERENLKNGLASLFAVMEKSGLINHSKFIDNSTVKDETTKKERNDSQLTLNSTHFNELGNPLVNGREGKRYLNENAKNSQNLLLGNQDPQTEESSTVNIFEFDEKLYDTETSDSITNPSTSKEIFQEYGHINELITVQSKETPTSDTENQIILTEDESMSLLLPDKSGVAQNDIFVVDVSEIKDEVKADQILFDDDHNAKNLTSIERIEIELPNETFDAVIQHENVENAINLEILNQEEPQILTTDLDRIPGLVAIEVGQNEDWKNTSKEEIKFDGENKQQETLKGEANEPQVVSSIDDQKLPSEYVNSGTGNLNEALNASLEILNEQVFDGGTVLTVMTENKNGEVNSSSTILSSQSQRQPLKETYISNDTGDISKLPMNSHTVQKLEGTQVSAENDTINTFSSSREQKPEIVWQQPNPSISTIQIAPEKDSSNKLIEENAVMQQVGSPAITNLESNVGYITTSITQPINSALDDQTHSSVVSPKQELPNIEVINIDNTRSNIPGMIELQTDEALDQADQYVESMQQSNTIENNVQIGRMEARVPVVTKNLVPIVNQDEHVQKSLVNVAQSINDYSDMNENNLNGDNKQYSPNYDDISDIQIVKADIPVVLELQPDTQNSAQYVATSAGSPQAFDMVSIDNRLVLSNDDNSEFIEVVELQPDIVDIETLHKPTQHVRTSTTQPQIIQTVSQSVDNDKIEAIQAEMPVLVEVQSSQTTQGQVVPYIPPTANQPEHVDEFTGLVSVQEQGSPIPGQDDNIELIKADVPVAIETDIPVAIEAHDSNLVQDQVTQYVAKAVSQPVNELVLDDVDGSLLAISNNDNNEISERVEAEIPGVFELHPDKMVNDHLYQYATNEYDHEHEEIPDLFVSRRNFIFGPDSFVLTTSQGKQIEVHKKYSTEDESGDSILEIPSTTNTESIVQNNIVGLSEIAGTNDESITIQASEEQAPNQHRIDSMYHRGPLWWVKTHSGFTPTGGDEAADGYFFSFDEGDVGPNPSEPFFSEVDNTVVSGDTLSFG